MYNINIAFLPIEDLKWGLTAGSPHCDRGHTQAKARSSQWYSDKVQIIFIGVCIMFRLYFYDDKQGQDHNFNGSRHDQ